MPYVFTYNIFPPDQAINILKIYLKDIKEEKILEFYRNYQYL